MSQTASQRVLVDVQTEYKEGWGRKDETVQEHGHREELQVPRWLQRYVNVLQLRSVRILILLAWAGVLAAGAGGIKTTFSNLRFSFDPIPGDDNDLARTAFRSSFPAISKDSLSIVLLSSTDGSDITSIPAAASAAARLGSWAQPYIAAGFLDSYSGASYFSYMNQSLPQFAAPLLSASRQETLLLMTSTEGAAVDERFKSFLVALRKETAAIADGFGGRLSCEVTGFNVVSSDSSDAILADIAVSDAITVSMAFCVLALALRSLKLIGITFINMVCTFGGAFLLAWPLTGALSTPNFTTSMMIATLVSLSLDYSLFLLSHLRGSLAARLPMPAAVAQMLLSSGHTVVVSGSTLAACFLVLAIFPVSIIRAPGIATTFSMLTNLTITPTLLLAFPRFFDEYAPPPGIEAAPEELPSPPAPEAQTLRWRVAARVHSAEAAVSRLEIWARLAGASCRYKWSISLSIFALLVAPFAYRLPHFQSGLSQSLRNIAPVGTPSVEAYYRIQSAFAPAILANARLVGVVAAPAAAAPGSAAPAALAPAFFASAAAAVGAVLRVSDPAAELSAADVSGLAWDGATGATDAAAISSALGASAACPASSAEACRAACPAAACALRILAAQTLAVDGSAMILRLAVRMDRDSEAGIAWVDRAHAALAAASEQGGGAVRWRLFVDPTADSVRYIYDNFGTLVGVTIAVIAFILAVAFRSVAIPLRALASLAAMEICIFGAATGVFCDGAMPGAAAGALGTFTSKYGLFWLMPLLAFSLTTGFGLDYDIFLMTAVAEERERGWSDADAVAVGLQRSGPVISWAGAIMAVAYSGYLFSSIPLLNQLGFFIVLAVLVDSFVVRPCLVPACMAVLGPVNWWPRLMPAVTRGPLPPPGAHATAVKNGAAAARVGQQSPPKPAADVESGDHH